LRPLTTGRRPRARGRPLSALTAAAAVATLSRRSGDGRLHLSDTRRRSYLATRLPATYAAIHASLASTAQVCQTLRPSLHSTWAQACTALWAAASNWWGLGRHPLKPVPPSAPGASSRRPCQPRFRRQPISGQFLRPYTARSRDPRLLDELSPTTATASSTASVHRRRPRHRRTRHSGGWQRILAARARLITAGAHIPPPAHMRSPVR
jgi:hypothetical protein